VEMGNNVAADMNIALLLLFWVSEKKETISGGINNDK